MRVLRKQWLLFKRSSDKKSVLFFSSFFGYFAYMIFNFPWFAGVIIFVITLIYFTMYRQHKRFQIRHRVIISFTRLQVNFNHHVEANRRDCILFLMGEYTAFQNRFEDISLSLETDLENLAHFRHKILKFAHHKDFFKDLCRVAMEVERIIESKHHLYGIRLHFYNKNAKKKFKQKAKDETQDVIEFEKLEKLIKDARFY